MSCPFYVNYTGETFNFLKQSSLYYKTFILLREVTTEHGHKTLHENFKAETTKT